MDVGNAPNLGSFIGDHLLCLVRSGASLSEAAWLLAQALRDRPQDFLTAPCNAADASLSGFSHVAWSIMQEPTI